MPKSESIKVICRIRPENEKEKASGCKSCITVTIPDSVTITDPQNPKEQHSFTFDHVFPSSTMQSEVFKIAAEPLLNEVFEGINCTLFCYGQTSSGKTFTMEGVREYQDLQGIIPRAMTYIFDKILSMSNDIEFSVKCSYYQIYNEKIQDLLDTRKTDLQIREDKSKGIWVDDCTEIYVSSEAEMAEVFQCGANNRTVAATEMNKGSSRSHSLFVVTIFQKNIVTDSTKSAKVFFVDLAGSEKMSKTGISGGMGLKEAQNINKSLMTLGMVINALTEGASHVPYRDSKLTRVLQESIGGNSQTTLIITCSPNGLNEGESVSTLRFGQRAKLIKNKVVANTVKSVKELMLYIAELEAKIKKLENAKGKIDDEKTEGSLTSRVKTMGDFEGTKCENCEKYISEVMNQRVELITLQEKIDDLTADKEDLEAAVKEKCQEIYDLNEKCYLSEAKGGMIVEDQIKLFQNIQLKLETFLLFTKKKKNSLDQIKTSLNSAKGSLPEKVFKFISKSISEMSSFLLLDKQNYDELLSLIGNNCDLPTEEPEHMSSKSSNMISNINFNINKNISINFSSSPRKLVLGKNPKSATSSPKAYRASLGDEKDVIADLISMNEKLKEENEQLTLEKYQTEIITNKLNDKITDLSSKVKEKEEAFQELNDKLCNLNISFEQYKQTTFEDFSKKEMKMVELANRIADLEDENYKLTHFNKDTFKKKFCVMDRQIKQFTLELQKKIDENNSLKSLLNRKNEEINTLSYKINELEAKVVNAFDSKEKKTDLSFAGLNSSFCTPISGIPGKGYQMTSINDLIRKKLSKVKLNNNISLNKSRKKSPTSNNFSNFGEKDSSYYSQMINNKIIKIIRGGNKKKEVAFFAKILKDNQGENKVRKEEELIKGIASNKKKFEEQKKLKIEKEMRMLDDDNMSIL